jgi:hypothetical protein
MRVLMLVSSTLLLLLLLLHLLLLLLHRPHLLRLDMFNELRNAHASLLGINSDLSSHSCYLLWGRHLARPGHTSRRWLGLHCWLCVLLADTIPQSRTKKKGEELENRRLRVMSTQLKTKPGQLLETAEAEVFQ